ncbi:GAF domain-containing protein [Desulfohalobium retbaense]|uniref:Phytochrome sensor protein n=1 Tax=Desulfohalobium retbaense (strain ATCC 49708 / DSM 5692 / JCM 16813 / HR100) TaxID=485915 RepID=C8X343_DESRD|nr:GAF domain-containing protein [Desulfohalobium retbaense]ACV68840.1 putative phytochrome sensor protein [Desulfohalobium retbaense DSM 5692]
MPRHNCLQQLLGIICSVFDAYSAVLFLPAAKDEYALAASFSLGDNLISGASVGQGKGLVGWIIRNNKPLLVNNFDREGGCLGYYNQEGESKIKAFMGHPLGQGDGALCLDSKKTYSFTTKDQKILDQFSRLVESLCSDFTSVQCSQEEHALYTGLQALHALQSRYPRWSQYIDRFVATIAEYTSFSHCFLAARDENGSSYFLEGWNQPLFAAESEHHQQFNIKSGLIGWVFKHQSIVSSGSAAEPMSAPVFGRDVQAPDFSSVICLPLVVNKITRGVLVLADEEVKPVSDQLRTFLEMASGQLGLLLENLYLKSRIHRQQVQAEKSEQKPGS